MPKLDLSSIPLTNATGYPPEQAKAVEGRWYRRLAPEGGLTDFGASHVVLKPGAWSSQRHWHEDEDEMVIMLSGEAVLIDDTGRTPMMPGDVAIFPKNDGNGHHLVNESESDCIFVALGRAAEGVCHYSDIDMRYKAGEGYTRRDGSPVAAE
ncbi:MAG: cupin domain-containing protein [Sphingobium sp.]